MAVCPVTRRPSILRQMENRPPDKCLAIHRMAFTAHAPGQAAKRVGIPARGVGNGLIVGQQMRHISEIDGAVMAWPPFGLLLWRGAGRAGNDFIARFALLFGFS